MPLVRIDLRLGKTASYRIYDPQLLDIERDDDVVFIQITFSLGRPVEKKQLLHKRIAKLLEQNPASAGRTS